MSEAILLSGGVVCDGVGNEAFQADVRIRDGLIAQVEPGLEPGDEQVIRVDGLTVMPGFIDAHVHGDATILDPEVQAAMTRQGITTVVLGQDGVSFAPSPTGEHDACAYAEHYFAAINGSHPTFHGGTVAQLLDTYDGATRQDAVYLAPHGTLRFAAMGAADRPATPAEIDVMCALLGEALDEGARGMSSGLEYAPAVSAQPAELEALSRVLAARGMPHSSHMRGYEVAAPGAVAELVGYARATGVATHIAHFHGPAEQLLPAIDAPRAEGLDLTFDSYPYLCGASILALIALPTWLPLADAGRTLEMLQDGQVLRRLRSEDLPARADVWPRVTLSFVPHPEYQWAEGLELVEVARRLCEPPQETALRLLVVTDLQVGCVFAQPPTNSEESVRALMRHEAHMAGSDGIYLGSRPHPRGWATFARFLARHVEELGDWSWPDAARHLAARAAARFGLADRGTVEAGKRADLAVIDPTRIRDCATYPQPRNLAEGVAHVYVRGVPTLQNYSMTQCLPGTAVR